MTNQDPTIYHLQIDNAFISIKDIEQPTNECRKLSKEVVNYILNRYAILPTTIAATVEEGVYLAYTSGPYRMVLEVYNDLTIAGLVADTVNQKILLSEAIGTMSYIHNLIITLLED